MMEFDCFCSVNLKIARPSAAKTNKPCPYYSMENVPLII
jgi:hypothetical protein